MMKLKILGATIMALFFSAHNLQAQTISKDNKVLVTYFSWSGNTKKVAEQIHELVGGDIFEIKTAKTYPEEYSEHTSLAKKEKNDNARPELSTHVTNMDEYDVVFVGFPIWWYTMPMPVFTFLEEYNFAGKTVVPFCTHGGGGSGSSEDDIIKLLPNSKYGEIFSVNGKKASSSKENIEKWLNKLSIEK